jgi:hypothetical protein
VLHHCALFVGSIYAPARVRQILQALNELEKARIPPRCETVYHVLTLGLSDKTSVRADFEDALASQLAVTGIECIPGNTILLRPEGTQFDLQYLTTQVRENRIATIVVSRLIRVDNSITYVPGTPYIAPYPYYNTFYGYYGAVYPLVYSPGYLKKEKKVRIETNVYAVS